MALDEPRENDESYEVEGFTYLVNRDFMDKVKPIKVDFMEIGFKLTCAVDFSAGSSCSACGTASSGCH